MGKDMLLRSLVVDPAFRGRGLGIRLVQDLFQRARRVEVHRIYLLTETAAEFFKRFGFQPLSRDEAPTAIKEHPEFQTLCPESAVLMVTNNA